MFDYEKFVLLWEKATSVQEVADAMGITRDNAATRASNLRRRGVALKHMAQMQPKINVERLNELIVNKEKP
jgi:biotin operon repressor